MIAREDKLEIRAAELGERERRLTEREGAIDKPRDERIRALESVTGLGVSQAKTMLLKDLEDTLRHDQARLVRQIEQETKRDADNRVRTSCRSSCSAWRPLTPPRRPSRSCSSRATT